jgi:hypothetical protein
VDIVIQVKGFEELQQKLQDPDLLAIPLRQFWNSVVLDTMQGVIEETPVDTGRLRASFLLGGTVTGVDPSPIPLWGQVGSNVEYGPYVETSGHYRRR